MQAHLAPALLLATLSLSALSACSAEEQTSSPIVLSEEMALRPGEAPPPPSLVIPDVVDLQATSDGVTPLPVLDPSEGDIQAETKAGETPASDAEANSDINKHADTTNKFIKKEENRLSECLSDRGGSRLADANCYSRHQEFLESAQTNLLQEIRAALSKPGPQGTDYTAAARLLEVSQRDWKSYIDADCEIVSEVFGRGNAQGLAGGECVMGHYEDRNESLKELKQSYLDN